MPPSEKGVVDGLVPGIVPGPIPETPIGLIKKTSSKTHVNPRGHEVGQVCIGGTMVTGPRVRTIRALP